MDSALIDKTVKDLLDIKKANILSKLVSVSNGKIKYTDLTISKPSIYCFWLKNYTNQVKSMHRVLSIKGPNEEPNELEWDWNITDTNILLYVGKTTNFKNRLKQHLLLGTPT